MPREQATLTPVMLDKYVRWTVAFRAYDRTCETYEEAVEHCERCDFDPAEIYPVPVGYEAVKPLTVAYGVTRDFENYHVFDHR